MTERFTILNMGLDGRLIKEDGKIIELERVVDLLNENEQLKELSDVRLKYVERCAKEKVNLVDWVSHLEKENEKLKQDNQRLIKMLDNVANYMQKEHREIPVDDFVEWWNKMATEGLENE